MLVYSHKHTELSNSYGCTRSGWFRFRSVFTHQYIGSVWFVFVSCIGVQFVLSLVVNTSASWKHLSLKWFIACWVGRKILFTRALLPCLFDVWFRNVYLQYPSEIPCFQSVQINVPYYSIMCTNVLLDYSCTLWVMHATRHCLRINCHDHILLNDVSVISARAAVEKYHNDVTITKKK